MILLNFTHPITDAQRAQIEVLTDQALERKIEIPAQFDQGKPFQPQIQALLDQADLTPADWQGQPILVVLPSLNFIAALLLAELHGRMGFFPPILRLRPAPGSLPRQFEVAEILDLQAVREAARQRR